MAKIQAPCYVDMRADIHTAEKFCFANSKKGDLGYALAYIHAVDQNEEECRRMGISPERALANQLCYILNNLSAWTGPEAREVKARMKAFVNKVHA